MQDVVADAISWLTTDWDADAPWRPWAHQTDPIKIIEVDIIWGHAPLLQPAQDKAGCSGTYTDQGGQHGPPGGSSTGSSPHAAAEDVDWFSPLPEPTDDLSNWQEHNAAATAATAAADDGGGDGGGDHSRLPADRGLFDVEAADHWILHVLEHGFSSSGSRDGHLGLRAAERFRRHAGLTRGGETVSNVCMQ